MRSDPVLRAFKVVVVTDRTDLEKQLSETAKLSGEVHASSAKPASSEILGEKGPALVFAMIQKYRDTDIAGASETRAGDDDQELLGVLNTDETIVVLVDEAHRSQTSTLHANLMAALPNAAKIGFTGTPIMREGKKRTEAIFGPFIDEYTIRQAEADGAIVRSSTKDALPRVRWLAAATSTSCSRTCSLSTLTRSSRSSRRATPPPAPFSRHRADCR